jgi:hypothetical protein
VSVCGNNIFIERWIVVVKGVLSNVMPFGFGISGAHHELVLVHLLSDGNGVHGSFHIWVFAEVWNRIVNLSWLPWIISWFWILILGDFAKRRGNWIRLEEIGVLKSNSQLVLSSRKILPGGLDAILKRWVVVVEGIFSNDVPFGLGVIGSHDQLVAHLLLGSSNAFHALGSFFVWAEVWNKVVDLLRGQWIECLWERILSDTDG